MDYFTYDYEKAYSNILSPNRAGEGDFTGKIVRTTWSSIMKKYDNNHPMKEGYAYTYDSKGQLINGEFGWVEPGGSELYKTLDFTESNITYELFYF